MINIAVMGCGTVGAGVCKMIEQNKAAIERQLGEPLQVCRVLDLDKAKMKRLGFSGDSAAESIDDILTDERVSIVVETMGGTGAALVYDAAVLRNGKHLVTSNKAVVEQEWDALHELAAQHGVQFLFDASVGGGVPVINTIRYAIAGCKINSIIGVLNGTSNYILSQMEHAGIHYGEALKQAQKNGFAEADPVDDVKGNDAARKIAILSRVAFGVPLHREEIQVSGITGIEQADFVQAQNRGCSIKQVAEATLRKEGLLAYVRPMLVPIRHPLAAVVDENNTVVINGVGIGDLCISGKGAGASPTAISVLSDVLAAAKTVISGEKPNPAAPMKSGIPILSPMKEQNKFYLRFSRENGAPESDKISVLLGRHGVGIASLERTQTEDIVITTQRTEERKLQALTEHLMQDETLYKITAIRIL